MSYILASDTRFSTEMPEIERKEGVTRSGFGKLPLIFLLVCAAIITVDRVAVPQVAFNVDSASYAVVSHEMLQGKSLYTDIWDHKPPAVFVAYGAAELLLGYSPQTLVFLNIFVSLITLFGLYYAGKAGHGGVISGLMAAGLWVILSGTFELEGRDPNTEPFLNACIIWAFALLADVRRERATTKISSIIGLLFLLASFFKPIVVAVALLLVCSHFIFSADRKRALFNTLIIGSIGFVGWLAMFGYFAATNRFEIFYDSIISYNQFYSGDMLASLIAPFRQQAEFFPDFINPLAVCAFAGVILTFINSRRHGAILIAFICSSWIAIALPGRFSVHYFQLWLPPLIIGASWAIGYIAVSRDFRIRVVSYGAAVLLLASLVFNQLPVYEIVLEKKWTPFIPLLNAGESTANKINGLLIKDETFFAWGNTPTLYLLTGRRPATPILFHLHFEESPISERLINRFKADMEMNRPELLVVENSRPPVPDWIAKDYEPTAIYQDPDTYSFFVRRGGRIASQNSSAGAER